MPSLLGILLVALVVGLFSIALHRAPELFVLRVAPGAPEPVRFVRGRVPPQLLHDLREILEPSGSVGTLRVLTRRGAVVVEARGVFSAPVQQRVRNTVGLYPLAKLRNGVTPRRG